MIVSERRGFIFFSIPKTASSTVRCTLSQFHDAPRKYPPHILPDDLFHKEGNKNYSSFYQFTFVRNPYDRLFAQFLEREKHIRETEAYVRNKASFNGIVQNDLEILNCPAFTRVWSEFGYSSYDQMHYWTHKDGEQRVDFIGYQERFSRDFEEVCRRLDLNIAEVKNTNIKSAIKPACDPHNMKLSDYKYLAEYEPETIRLVNRLYRREFDLFDYPMISPDGLQLLALEPDQE